jgi:acyl carrier protein
MDDIKNRTRAFLGQFVGTAQLGTDDEDLFARGLVNSLFAMQLIAWVEKSFEVQVEDEDLEITNFNSVSAIARFVAGKRQAALGAAVA